MLVSLEFDWRSESLPFFLEGAGNRTSLAGEFLDLMEKMVRGKLHCQVGKGRKTMLMMRGLL